VGRRPMLVLLVSADTALQQTVQQTLRPHRLAVVCAATVDKARAILRQASPDLLIADLGHNLESLRAHLAPTTAVLGLSSPDDSGAHDLAPVTVSKPFDDTILMAAIHRLRGGD
jgi:DNA-binding response OmpR family regulator